MTVRFFLFFCEADVLIVASHRQSPGEAIRFTAEDFIDCFVASAPRNDDVADFQFSAAFLLAACNFSERFLSLAVFDFQDNSSHAFPLSLLLRKFSSLSKNISCFHLSGFNLK